LKAEPCLAVCFNALNMMPGMAQDRQNRRRFTAAAHPLPKNLAILGDFVIAI
jgi:hypothetical protein